MSRFVVHKFILDDIILIDTVKKAWVFYNTNIWGQFYNLDEKPKKVSKQRINGFIKRASSINRYYQSDGYAIDPFVYYYILSDEQKAQVVKTFDSQPRDFIAEGDDLEELMTRVCQYTLKNCRNAKPEDDYYKNKLQELALQV